MTMKKEEIERIRWSYVMYTIFFSLLGGAYDILMRKVLFITGFSYWVVNIGIFFLALMNLYKLCVSTFVNKEKLK